MKNKIICYLLKLYKEYTHHKRDLTYSYLSHYGLNSPIRDKRTHQLTQSTCQIDEGYRRISLRNYQKSVSKPQANISYGLINTYNRQTNKGNPKIKADTRQKNKKECWSNKKTHRENTNEHLVNTTRYLEDSGNRHIDSEDQRTNSEYHRLIAGHLRQKEKSHQENVKDHWTSSEEHKENTEYRRESQRGPPQ